MQFTPKSEAQIIQESLLPDGVYPFTVQVAQEKTSKLKEDGSGGNPMIEVQLEVFDADGRGHKMKDYLMEKLHYKLLHFMQAVGLSAEYETGNVPADIIQGRSGMVQIRTEPASGQYMPKNSVKDYVKPDANAVPTAQPSPRATKPADAGGASPDDSPPFMRKEEWE